MLPPTTHSPDPSKPLSHFSASHCVCPRLTTTLVKSHPPSKQQHNKNTLNCQAPHLQNADRPDTTTRNLPPSPRMVGRGGISVVVQPPPESRKLSLPFFKQQLC